MAIRDGLPQHIASLFSTGAGAQGINTWNQIAKHIAGEDISPLKWNLSSISFDQREHLSSQMMRLVLGVRPDEIGELIDADATSIFQVRRPAEGVLKSGYGSFVMDPSEFIQAGIRGDVNDIFQKLSFITPNIKIPGGSGRNYTVSQAYKSDFLRHTAQQVVDAADILKGKSLIFDVETAGLAEDSGIWQLSARMMEGGKVNLAGGAVREFLFDNPNMDLGAYALEGKPMDFKTFYEALTKTENINWETDFVRPFGEFLDMALEADYIVGQNVSFDVEQLAHSMRRARESGEVAPEILDKLSRFNEKLASGKVIDTKIMSEMLFSNTMTIDPNLQRVGKFTPFSMENIFLRTNFLDELAADLGDDGWDTITQLLQKGAHHADVDTFFEGHLFRMQLETLSGQRDMWDPNTGRGLRALAMGEMTLSDDLTKAIREASAITPFTKMAGDISGVGEITPLEHMIELTRKLDDPLREIDLANVPFKAGMFERWADEMLLPDGRLRVTGALTDSGYADIPGVTQIPGRLQKEALARGLPFGGLSSIERLITTQISRLGGGVQGADIRSLMGDIVGTGAVRRTEGINIYNRNLAISTDILRAAEEEGIIGTSFNKVLAGDLSELQTARWSVVNAPNKQGLALVADVFEDEKQMQKFASWINDADEDMLKRLGISSKEAADLAVSMDEERVMRGIQIGFLDADQDENVRGVVNLLDQLGFNIDSPDTLTLRTAVFGAGDEVAEEVGDKVLFTGATVVGDMPEEGYLRNLLRAREFNKVAYAEVGRDAWKSWGVATTKTGGDAFTKIYDTFKNVKARNVAGVAAGVLTAGWLWKKSREQEEYEGIMEFQGYESGPPPRDRSIHGRPLETAGTVQVLDRQKTGHHQMGPNKYDHLF